MKQKYLLPLLWLTLLVGVSCKEDDYVYPSVVTEFIDGQTDSEGVLSRLITDEGEVYTIQLREGLDGLTPDSLYRTVSVYQPLTESGEVYLYSAQLIMALDPLPAESFTEGVVTDPLDVRSVWRSGDYINLILKPMVKDKNHAFHFADYGITEEGGANTLHLTLYHNRNDDYEAFTREVYLSIPLREYKDKLRSGDTIALQINTYEKGFSTYTFTY